MTSAPSPIPGRPPLPPLHGARRARPDSSAFDIRKLFNFLEAHVYACLRLLQTLPAALSWPRRSFDTSALPILVSIGVRENPTQPANGTGVAILPSCPLVWRPFLSLTFRP